VLRFSLIVPTIARTNELKRLLESLAQQEFCDYEVILVDQNYDDRIQEVVDEFVDRVPLIRVSCPKGASKARNVGLSLAIGEIIAFPDDDCWYSPGLLRNIDEWFRGNPKYSILAVGAADDAGLPSGNRWFQDSCDLHPINVFRTTFCSALFLRRDALRETSFDEGIGPGSDTIFACGDETDLILTILGSGFRGRFDRSWHIGHPRRDMLSHGVSNDRAVSYGCGMGRVLRKHSLFLLWVGLLSYDVLRVIVVVLRGSFSPASLCFAHAWGLIRGFSAELTRQGTPGREVNSHVPEQ
jgi:glycosyltransferase involved in cell wall biosynthesis